ncbi:MAG: GNAT family N-acetyltransferase [Pirellulales bacterium]|nr:GNAT family N-acetyltransferase [Pirellulales bacterium]
MPTSRSTAKQGARQKRSVRSHAEPRTLKKPSQKKRSRGKKPRTSAERVAAVLAKAQVEDKAATLNSPLSQIMLGANVPSTIVTRGDAGDHPGVQRFLQSVQPELSPEAFAAVLEEPLYEPSDRIVARLGTRVVGHALVSRRDAYVGDALTPVSRVSQITILPELRGQGLGPKLLQAAEERIVQDQSPLGLLATPRPAFFEQHGWLPMAKIRRTQITTRNIVGILEANSGALSGRWRVQPWRQMEYGHLEKLYQSTVRGTFGGYERTEAFWRWVVGSCCPARLLVASDQAQRGDGELVGYVILRGESILEVAARDNRQDILHALLHRACVEAIERSLHRLEFEAAADHPAHRMLGYDPERENGQATSATLLAKVFDRCRLLQSLTPGIDARAKDAGVERPCELGFRVVNEPALRLMFQPRSVKLANSGLGRSYLRCSPESFTRILLGRPKQQESIRFRSSTERAKTIASAIFPRLPARFCSLEY